MSQSPFSFESRDSEVSDQAEFATATKAGARIEAGVASTSPLAVPLPGSSARGRGAAENPPNRFEVLHYEADTDAWDEAWDRGEGSGDALGGGPAARPQDAPARRVRTVYLRDGTRSVLTHNDSPDVPFDVGLNPYRGCEHGCIYCYARPTHEFLGFSVGLDFESRILVKERAPELLRKALAARSWRPQVVGMSGVTDAYQPIERRLRLTRRCLQVFSEFRNPVGLVTKNGGVTRDIDVLAELAAVDAVRVSVSVTSLDPALQRRMEPRASDPFRRLAAIRSLADAGVPVGVVVAPVIPGLTDHEIPAILEAAADAGAQYASYINLRLPHGVKDLFSGWLERHYPERASKVLSRVRESRAGQLNDPRFGSRMRGEGEFVAQVDQLFELGKRKAKLGSSGPELSTTGFRRPSDRQLRLL